MALYMLSPKMPSSFDDYMVLTPRYLKVAKIEVVYENSIRFYFYDSEMSTEDMDYITLEAQTSADAELIANKYRQAIDRSHEVVIL